VPGAYAIIRSDLLDKIGFFDPNFFLYYEEVDLCVRIQKMGYKIMYWPEIEVVHVGGESSRQVKTLELSQSGAQLVLWRMRSTLLFYRKHKGQSAFLVMAIERLWYILGTLRNRLRSGETAESKKNNQRRMSRLMRQAWRETNGGRTSPPQPW
jgi:GT2 family glycosyltransferase